MANIRAMFIGHGPSNLPEDRVVNTFHFSNADTYAAHSALVANAVSVFYTTPYAGDPLCAYRSPWVQPSAEIRIYNMTDIKPRVPIIVPLTLSAYLANAGLPEEVALCLSYHGATPPAVTARRRGRIYIGPLCTSAGQVATNTLPSRPATNFVNTLTGAATGLIDAAGVDWCVLGKDGYVPIVGGYVDNAFDTQRRRGPITTDRTLFTSGV